MHFGKKKKKKSCAFIHLQTSGDESAVLWLDQIQQAILTANQDEEEALTRMYLKLCVNYLKELKESDMVHFNRKNTLYLYQIC